jgi:hypothetical protein
MKRAPRWGEVISKKFSGHIIIFSENNRNFPDIPKYKNKCNHKSKVIRRRKCNLTDIFHDGKGHFATGKRALLKTGGGGLGPLAPHPLCSYAPE